MAKMVKSAQGELIDWDLLKIQSQVNNNVAEPVEIVDQAAIAARRQQRAKLDAARKMLEKAQQEAVAAEAVAAVAAEAVAPTKKAKNA
jgi:hypothetical protein